MAEEIRGYGDASLPALLSKHIGETVNYFYKKWRTIRCRLYRSNSLRKRLLCTPYYKNWASSGMFPCNACTNFNVDHGYDYKNPFGSYDCGHGYGKGHGYIQPASELGTVSAGGWNGYPVYTVGSVTDIPISAIVSFVHNAV